MLFLSGILAALVVLRLIEAISHLHAADETAFLAFPLAVIVPVLAFLFLAKRTGLSSQEGVLMQLGAMIQLVLIVALPKFALYLALGFPVVFLVVEIFETRSPEKIRSWIKNRVISC